MAARVVVVGAGPAGLATAAALRRQGIPYTLLEQSISVASSWRGRYDALQLHTARWLSGLPYATIPRRFGRWVGRDDLISYLEDYAGRFGVEPEFGVEVTRIERADGGWRVEASDGVRFAPTVVLATGYTRTPFRPAWPGMSSFPGPFLHSSDYRSPTGFRDQHVLVVGGGNSAAEIAADLVGMASRVTLSVRRPPTIIRRDTLGIPNQLIGIAVRAAPERIMNPMSDLLRRLTVPDLRDFGLPARAGDDFTHFLRSRTVPILDHGFVDRVRAGQIRVVGEIASCDGAQIRLGDGSVLAPDAVIAATGYRPDLEGIVDGLGLLDERGMPRVHGADTVPGAPGLHVVGITIELAGLLREVGREARAIARLLAG